MIGIKEEYKDVVFWDILTQQINEQEYEKDNALFRVRQKIILVLDKFYKTLYVSPSEHISVATLFGPERRKHRTFELHIINTETKSVQYSLSYFQGDLQVSDGNLQTDIIVYLLRSEGYWE